MEFFAYQQSDIPEIQALFHKTFADSEGEAEGKIIGELAAELLTGTPQDDLYCFVAKNGSNKELAACIIFSRMQFEQTVTAFILSPVAVLTPYQGQGFGQKLIRFGLEKLRQDGVELAFTYGDPTFYYQVGFEQIPETQIKAPQPLSYPIGWLAQSLTEAAVPHLPGESSCVPALNKAEYW